MRSICEELEARTHRLGGEVKRFKLPEISTLDHNATNPMAAGVAMYRIQGEVKKKPHSQALLDKARQEKKNIARIIETPAKAGLVVGNINRKKPGGGK